MSSSAGFWQRPQAVGWRRALFQAHLWAGLAIGLYVFVISLSGSAIVLRGELDKALCPQIIIVRPAGPRLSSTQLLAAAGRVFARFPRFNPALIHIVGPRVPGAAVEVWYSPNGGRLRLERLIDPYSGRDLGDTVACEPAPITWIANLHDQLLGGYRGERLNGAGAVMLTLMCLTGLVLWWPGRSRWQRSLTLHQGVGWRRFSWDLHSVIGFWMFLLLLLWSFTAIYLAFPRAYYGVIGLLFRHGIRPRDPAQLDRAVAWMVDLHFGRRFGTGVEVLWVGLGLAPAGLIVTGALMWWNRVVRRVMGRAGESLTTTAPSATPALSMQSQPASLPAAADLSP